MVFCHATVQRGVEDTTKYDDIDYTNKPRTTPRPQPTPTKRTYLTLYNGIAIALLALIFYQYGPGVLEKYAK